MKKFLIIVCQLQLFMGTFAQKPPIDHSVYAGWAKIGAEKISNSGEYMAYMVYSKKIRSLVIGATDRSWTREVTMGNDVTISADNRYIIYTLPKDSLAIFETAARKISRVVPGVRSYKMLEMGKKEWLACLNKDKEVQLYDLGTGIEKHFAGIKDYYFCGPNKKLLLLKETGGERNDPLLLEWVDLGSGQTSSIWKGKHASGFTFDDGGTRLAFMEEQDRDGQTLRILRLYRPGMDSAIILVDDRSPGIAPGFRLGGRQMDFSKDGKKLFLGIRAIPGAKPDPKLASVDIWNYKDDELQSAQLHNNDEYAKNRDYLAVINDGDNKVIRLQEETDAFWVERAAGGKEEYVLVRTKQPNNDFFWKRAVGPDLCLVSTVDGSRLIIKKQLHAQEYASFSPSGQYLTWYDAEKRHYFVYDVRTRGTRNITLPISVPVYEEINDFADLPHAYGIAGWLENDSSVLIYDRYDIWRVDPDGIKAPVNITLGYGRKNKIVLRYAVVEGSHSGNPVIRMTDPFFIAGFNGRNKYNGFFRADLTGAQVPVMLNMGPYNYYFPMISAYSRVSLSNFLGKARDAEQYLVKRSNPTEFPNIYSTRDFIHFTALSDLQPQKAYNWMTARLEHYRMADGKTGEGILYRPENFDPAKKYPVIFTFYEKLTDGINKFLTPDYSIDRINIPWFVSNGYIVFVPDIYYKIGCPGQGVLNALEAAAKYMSRFAWVDAHRMGIQGHSWGGYEVNDLITRTHLFKAAVSAAGPSDWISIYTNVGYDGYATQAITEKDQGRLGATLWQRPDLYIQNSPVLRAPKVTTPLLIMHNKQDANVSWSQGVEYFTSLRRLGKKVWMLQYDGETHSLGQEKNSLDYSIRMAQFFDHYLKDAPAPKWMTQGVPARLKGIDSGLDLDDSGKQP